MSDEIPEDYYLKYPNEGNTGKEEDDIRGWPDEEGIQKNNPPTKWKHEEGNTGVENEQDPYVYIHQANSKIISMIKQNAALIASLKELIRLTEYFLDWSQYKAKFIGTEEIQSAIENAKHLTDGK